MRWKAIGAALLLVVGIGAAAIAVIGPDLGGSAATQYLTSQAAVQDVVEEVAATGTVQAATTYSLAFGSAPTLGTSSSAQAQSASAGGGTTSWVVTSVAATPGQAVKAGDVLATADATNAEITLTVAEAQLASARARLVADKRGLTAAEKAAARLQVTQAQQSASQASASYTSSVAQNRLKVIQAEAAVSRALTAYRAARKTGPQSAIDQARSAWTQAREQLATLRLQVSQSNSQAANQVTQANLQLQSARLSYQQKTAATESATLATDRAGVAQAEQAVADAKASMLYTSLVSPVDGVVVTVDVTPGLAAPSTDALTIRSTAFQVSADVAESDLPLVRVGQEATVTITALDTDVTGTVRTIDQVPSSSSSGVVSYGIVVTLPEPPEGTVPGMSAEISVTAASSPGVLAVPVIALGTAADGSYTVRVLDASGAPQTVPVQVGLITSSLAEITSGISEGTAVVVGTASDRTSSGTTTTRTGIPALDGGGFPGGGQFPGQRP